MFSIFNSELLLCVTSIAFIFILTTMLLACVCCQKPVQKDDLLGLDGMVKITNPDENVNHVANSTNDCVINVTVQPPLLSHTNNHHDMTVIENVNKSSTRPSGGSNSNRSLPDIPCTAEPGIEAIADTNSEIYATVEDKTAQLTAQNYVDGDYSPRTASISTGVDSSTRPSLSQQSSLSQADAPYARLKSEHPYDKLKKEHPYASVQKPEKSNGGICNNNTRNLQTVDRNSNDVLLTIPHSPVAQRASVSSLVPSSEVAAVAPPPIAPPRSRRSSSHLSLQASISTSDIPAATAVAGRVAASQELPYMTPPQLQQNFSGDSQDSSKGYTSISVREPLANILAQTQSTSGRTTRRQELSDSHYATVSDDSDEMYAAIEEPNQQIYNSGSETYAQIQPTPRSSNVETPNYNIVDASVKTDDNRESGNKSPAPQPPSVDSLRQVAHVHSRQASSSSCTSSVANLGSPKPEKRQANSPLPPRPPISPEPRLNTSSIARNLEDMYAKVHKNKKKKDNVEQESSDRRLSTTIIDLGSSARSSVHSQVDNLNLGKSWPSRESIHQQSEIADVDFDKTDFGHSKIEHCYEKIVKNDAKKRNSFEKLNLTQRQLPPVAIVNNYENSGPESLLSNDPGYEVLHKTSRPPSDCDPNYEVLKPTSNSTDLKENYSSLKRYQLKNKALYSSIHKKSQDPGYESVNLPSSSMEQNFVDEPNYESMTNSDEPGYTSVASKNCPGYESLKRSKIADIEEPNYESMPSSEEPPYASVAGGKSGSETDSTRDDPNYESVKYYRKEDYSNSPGYEQIRKSETNSDEVSEVIGYERVGRKIERISVEPNSVVSVLVEKELAYRRRSISPQSSVTYEHSARRGSSIIEDGVYKV